MIEEDYLGKPGCCLVCVESGVCSYPCFGCKCTKCSWYYIDAGKGNCGYLAFKRGFEWFEDLRIVRTTDKAVLVEDDDGKRVWLPKSQILIKKRAGKLVIAIPRWLIEKLGLDTSGWFELDGYTFAEFEKRRLSVRYERDEEDLYEV